MNLKKGLHIINTIALCEAVRCQPRIVIIHYSIMLILEGEHPFESDNVDMSRATHKLPHAMSH